MIHQDVELSLRDVLLSFSESLFALSFACYILISRKGDANVSKFWVFSYVLLTYFSVYYKIIYVQYEHYACKPQYIINISTKKHQICYNVNGKIVMFRI